MSIAPVLFSTTFVSQVLDLNIYFSSHFVDEQILSYGSAIPIGLQVPITFS